MKDKYIHLPPNHLCLLNLFQFYFRGWAAHHSKECFKGSPSFLPVPFSPGTLIQFSLRTNIFTTTTPHFGTAVTPTLHFPFCSHTSNVVLSPESIYRLFSRRTSLREGSFWDSLCNHQGRKHRENITGTVV